MKSDTVFNYYVLLLGAAGSSLPSVGPSLDPFLDPSLNASASPGRGWVSLTRGEVGREVGCICGGVRGQPFLLNRFNQVQSRWRV